MNEIDNFSEKVMEIFAGENMLIFRNELEVFRLVYASHPDNTMALAFAVWKEATLYGNERIISKENFERTIENARKYL